MSKETELSDEQIMRAWHLAAHDCWSLQKAVFPSEKHGESSKTTLNSTPSDDLPQGLHLENKCENLLIFENLDIQSNHQQRNGANKMSAHTVLVNNTNCNVSMFDAALLNCVHTGCDLPEELADLFTLTFITVDGQPRGILNAA